MVEIKNNLKKIIHTLAGRATVHVVRNQTNRDCLRVSYDEALKHKPICRVVPAPSDLNLFRVEYMVRKARHVVGMREVRNEVVKNYTASLGKFYPKTVDNFIKSIPEYAIITKVEFIIGHELCDNAGPHRRKVTINNKDLYIDTASNDMNYVSITKKGMEINKVNRNTGVFYKPMFLGGKSDYAHRIRYREVEGKIISRKTWRFMLC